MLLSFCSKSIVGKGLSRSMPVIHEANVQIIQLRLMLQGLFPCWIDTLASPLHHHQRNLLYDVPRLIRIRVIRSSTLVRSSISLLPGWLFTSNRLQMPITHFLRRHVQRLSSYNETSPKILLGYHLGSRFTNMFHDRGGCR